MPMKYGYVRPIELIIEDEDGRQMRAFATEVHFSGDQLAPTDNWVLLKIQGSINSLKINKTPTEKYNEERSLLQVLESEPFAAMLALADWYLENAPNATLRDRLSRGLQYLVKAKRLPRSVTGTPTAYPNINRYAWEPLLAGRTLDDACHYLPVQVYDTIVSLREGWQPSQQKIDPDSRVGCILRAAMAWSMVTDGVGAVTRISPPVGPNDLTILQALHRATRSCETDHSLTGDIRAAVINILGWTQERFAGASGALAFHQGLDEIEDEP